MKNIMTHSKKGILMVTMFATMLSFANDASILMLKMKQTEPHLL